jgi:hypothetical protein
LWCDLKSLKMAAPKPYGALGFRAANMAPFLRALTGGRPWLQVRSSRGAVPTWEEESRGDDARFEPSAPARTSDERSHFVYARDLPAERTPWQGMETGHAHLL